MPTTAAAGAYAVISSPTGEVLIVEANGGRLYLPGGRVEAGETLEQALLREIEEECGSAARVLGKLGEVVQPVEDGRTSINAHYFEAELRSPVGAGEYKTGWMPAAEAAARVHRRGDAWAILTAAEQRKTSPAEAGSPGRGTAR